MRPEFVIRVLRRLVDDGELALGDRILAVCSDVAERQVFQSIGFTDVTISNLDPRLSAKDCEPYATSFQNAMNLTFDDQSFDFAFVSDGLHHCSSPHRALVEMYRVSRKGVVIVESRDSLLVKVAVAMGLSQEYEVSAVTHNQGALGGVDNSEVPNYIYRWTEREFSKTVRACDPAGRQRFRYFYGFSAPGMGNGSLLRRWVVGGVSRVLAVLVPLLARRQGNSFAMVALRPRLPDDLWPWLEQRDGAIRFRPTASAEVETPPR